MDSGSDASSPCTGTREASGSLSGGDVTPDASFRGCGHCHSIGSHEFAEGSPTLGVRDTGGVSSSWLGVASMECTSATPDVVGTPDAEGSTSAGRFGTSSPGLRHGTRFS
jgi:hypothetical protein